MQYVAVLRVWHQCSADCNAELKIHTRVFGPDDTVGSVMAWAESYSNSFGAGNLMLTQAEQPTTDKGKP